MTGLVAGDQGVWLDLVGQGRAIAELRRAVADASSGAGYSMTHAWLITGPPGSGRSNAARAFAAAVQCERGGCGDCIQCRTSLSGAHPDVTLVRTEKLSIGVEEVRDLVGKGALSPALGRWQIIVVEDADRITDRGANALLKSIEEPPPRTVWVLCAPSAEDVVVTIRSRSREVKLVTPSNKDVEELLVRRDRIDRVRAGHAARAAQGHIGRARVLASNDDALSARHDVLRIPGQLVSVGACLHAADALVKAAKEQAAAATSELDSRERAELQAALGFGSKGARPRNTEAALKDLDEQQKARAKRLQRDALDRVLTELTTWYRDVLNVQGNVSDPTDLESATGPLGLINAELRAQVASAARQSTPEETLRRIDAILACREALETNVAPLLAMEALLLELAHPSAACA